MHTNIQTFKTFLWDLQNRITKALSKQDGSPFLTDRWEKSTHTQGITGHGNTMILKQGNIIEQGGVNLSIVSGDKLPPSATTKLQLAGCHFEAMGLSLVIHPRNPYIPTSHASIRLFIAHKNDNIIDWWFGGKFDLTPYYPFDEDCQHWHHIAAQVAGNYYPTFKKWCDDYFYLPHRQETRGIGGLFFDDFNELPMPEARALTQNIGNAYLDAYLPILEKRKHTPYGERQCAFQKYRRGRYVEFNLIYDRGTHFGLQSGGRTESILMSLPPEVRF